jgi:endonuclease V-like protein UPF0215 family
MKPGARILGIDDSPFEHEDDSAFLTGVVYQGTEFIEDVRKLEIEVDGDRSSDRVIELHERCGNTRQIKAVIVDGISLAGFNVVDIEKVAEELEKPVIATTSNRPKPERFRSAMEKSGNNSEVFGKLPEPEQVELVDGTCYIQYAGCEREEAVKILRSSIIHGLTPESVRVAHMIGKAFGGDQGSL